MRKIRNHGNSHYGKSAGGVLLPKSAVKFERYLMGEVVSVGTEAGIVDAGKKVLFSDINAYEVNLGTPEKHCFCRAGDLLAVGGWGQIELHASRDFRSHGSDTYCLGELFLEAAGETVLALASIFQEQVGSIY
eukprot:Gb_18848 [translate_table: standard]